MVIIKRGNLFDSEAPSFCCPTNMLGGVDEAFLQRFPVFARAYVEACRHQLVEPGKVWTYERPDGAGWLFACPLVDPAKQVATLAEVQGLLMSVRTACLSNNVTWLALGAENPDTVKLVEEVFALLPNHKIELWSL